MLIATIPFTSDNFWQLVANGIVNGSAYALVAVGFGLIINVTGRFHIAFGAVYALTAFIVGQVGLSWDFPYGAAMAFGVICGVVVAVLIERMVYWPLNRRVGASALFVIFIVSLGLSTAGTGMISLLWLGSGTVNIQGFQIAGQKLGPIFTTNLDIASVCTAVGAIGLVAAVIRWTRLGRMIRAVRVNPELSLAVGIDPKIVYMSVFAIGSALGGIGAVFTATKSTSTPDMGANSILYAITVAFLAGASASPVRIAATALIVGLVEALSGFFVEPQWSQVVVFSALLVYVLFQVIKGVNIKWLARRPRVAPAS